jgi:L-asparaginase
MDSQTPKVSTSSEIHIRLLITGGTFDKEYNELTGQLFFRDTHVQDMLDLGRCRVGVTVEKLMMRDSLEMTQEHRSEIREACRRSRESRIVITHGTDTMEQTARCLGEANLDKTIILTGAMVPYKFGSSDGLFNLGAAIALAQALPPDIYVAMNGRFFIWSNVTKDRQTGEFKELARAPDR